jgi:ketosteroid isomerase-like protein
MRIPYSRKFAQMSRRLSPFLILVALCFVLAATAWPNQSEKDIRAVMMSQQQAWNRGDIDGFMNGYARSSSTTFVSEDTVTRGWQTVRDRYHKKYSDRARMGTLAFSDLEVTQLSGGFALVLGRWKLKRAHDQPQGRFTLVFRQLPEGWRIVHDHTSTASKIKKAN